LKAKGHRPAGNSQAKGPDYTVQKRRVNAELGWLRKAGTNLEARNFETFIITRLDTGFGKTDEARARPGERQFVEPMRIP
jgi:hypothetical protein